MKRFDEDKYIDEIENALLKFIGIE